MNKAFKRETIFSNDEWVITVSHLPDGAKRIHVEKFEDFHHAGGISFNLETLDDFREI